MQERHKTASAVQRVDHSRYVQEEPRTERPVAVRERIRKSLRHGRCSQGERCIPHRALETEHHTSYKNLVRHTFEERRMIDGVEHRIAVAVAHRRKAVVEERRIHLGAEERHKCSWVERNLQQARRLRSLPAAAGWRKERMQRAVGGKTWC